MPANRTKTIGILGGMGPLATCDLFSKIICFTGAMSDNGHLHILIDNDPSVPDRTEAILKKGPSPQPRLCAMAYNLEQSGAELLLLPCNTAHYYFDAIQQAVGIPLLHMPRLTAANAAAQGLQSVALLATEGTILSGIYEQAFSMYGIDVLLPDLNDQREITDIIYNGIKANNQRFQPAAFIAVAEKLLQRGGQALVLGCTELPLAFDRFKLGHYPYINPTNILAQEAIRAAGGQVWEG